jgi:hypothetical protein
MVQRGFEEYQAMCATCHGAPGSERGALGKGMNPEPPDLAEEAAKWSDRELFWITKHGIKLAGMSGLGVTHSDEELCRIVAGLRRLEHISADEYRRLTAQAGAHPDAHGAEERRASQCTEPWSRRRPQRRKPVPLPWNTRTRLARIDDPRVRKRHHVRSVPRWTTPACSVVEASRSGPPSTRRRATPGPRRS